MSGSLVIQGTPSAPLAQLKYLSAANTTASAVWSPSSWSINAVTPAVNMVTQLGTLLRPEPTKPDDAPPDATFPFGLDLGSPYCRFHLLTWRDSVDALSPQAFWSQTTGGLEGMLAFRQRRTRAAFARWWAGYAARFFDGAPPCGDFLPHLRPGRFSGVFVAHPTMLDHLPYQYCASPDGSQAIDTYHLTFGLIEVLPAWAWIVANCRKPVFRQQGGWLFSSVKDAVTFTLFNPTEAATPEES